MSVATRIWEQAPGRPAGYVRVARTRSCGEVLADLRRELGGDAFGGVPGAEEYFGLTMPFLDGDAWPDGAVVCFAVEGSSEGHYVHVQVAQGGGWETQRRVLLGKTFCGADAAWQLARRISDLVEVG